METSETNSTGIPEEERIEVELIGTDGNVFALLGVVSRALKRNGQGDKSEEMIHRLDECQSYSDALNLMGEYVIIV